MVALTEGRLPYPPLSTVGVVPDPEGAPDGHLDGSHHLAKRAPQRYFLSVKSQWHVKIPVQRQVWLIRQYAIAGIMIRNSPSVFLCLAFAKIPLTLTHTASIETWCQVLWVQRLQQGIQGQSQIWISTWDTIKSHIIVRNLTRYYGYRGYNRGYRSRGGGGNNRARTAVSWTSGYKNFLPTHNFFNTFFPLAFTLIILIFLQVLFGKTALTAGAAGVALCLAFNCGK